MGKPSKRPMGGFKKIVFADDGASTTVSCPKCGQTRCFCTRTDMSKAPAASKAPAPAALPAENMPRHKKVSILNSPAAASILNSPAPSVLSLTAGVSPTFSFQPYSGYGNVLPEFSLDGETVAVDMGAGSSGSPPRTKKFFCGGSPSWIVRALLLSCASLHACTRPRLADIF